jgi:hypothetical protein
MKNAMKLVGVAVVVLLTFGLAACGEPEEETLEGSLSITANEFGNYVGFEITAKYTGSESVTYKWEKGGEAVSGGSNGKFTPEEPGVYAVSVSADGYSNTVKSTDDVDIVAAPAYVAFLGRWKVAKGSGGANGDETITVKSAVIRLDYDDGEGDVAYFEIKDINQTSGWTSIGTKPNWASALTYGTCYQVKGTVANGTGDAAYLSGDGVTAHTSNGIYLFLTDNKATIYRGFPDATDVIKGGNPVAYRAYAKQ